MSTIASTATTPARGLVARGRWLLGGAAAIALLTVALPSMTGVPWASTWGVVAAVPLLQLGGLVALWALGLLSHTVTLTAAMPTLTHRRALTLSLTGSAVANVLPLGGAAGIALNYRMSRHWGFTRAQFAAYTVVTNAWDVLAKLALPLAVVPAFALLADAAVRPLLGPSLLASGVLALVAGLLAAGLSRPSVAARVGRFADRFLGAALRLTRRQRELNVQGALVALQASCDHVVRTRWLRLTAGMTLYTALLFALMWACLSVTGSGLAPAAILGGFAVERLLTLAGITPGGAGVVEVGLTGTLIALGGDPAGAVAGVLLYRALTFGLEIPVGGIGLAAWLWLRRRDPVT